MLSSENNQYCEPFDNCLGSEAAKGRFIELIKQNPIIYDSKYAKKSAANSRNVARVRKSAWEAIGKEMKQTPGLYGIQTVLHASTSKILYCILVLACFCQFDAQK